MSTAAPSNASSAPYHYERLTSNTGEIRLVQITRVEEDADKDSVVLEIDILHTRLDQAGPYLAISYAWGNPERTHKLLVNGAALLVPENTFRTLYTVYHAAETLATELCASGEQVSLWIDAICINQSDIDEKEDQVRRMGQIYSQAAGAIGYIGRPPQGKNPFDGFRTLLWMGTDVSFTIRDDVPVDAAHAWIGEWSRDPGRFEEEVGPIEEFAEAYNNLLLSDWFIRCWVVQEMVLSREIACLYGHGSDFAVMSLDILTTLVDGSGSPENSQHFYAIYSAMKPDAEVAWARNKKEAHMKAWSRIRDDLEQRQSGGLGLIELLERTRFGKVTDPRDRIYSLMGMMKEPDRSAIRPRLSPTLWLGWPTT
ncbi:heterokaryon incompatibility protein-domain-containing protein [Schizothecium vesticola]|uniref:Heterokaryon incompatibility protein-domain-containing protein n=1 Tax=Schizothecium vesticola TaxID=314040 RepID=A0AA40K9C2_9PEZI|nr:heterokaryon incompatibility protein-domain-containing protein [Schizothecium vesticola]